MRTTSLIGAKEAADPISPAERAASMLAAEVAMLAGDPARLKLVALALLAGSPRLDHPAERALALLGEARERPVESIQQSP